MKTSLKLAVFGAAALLLSAFSASAATAITDANGMTLYTFDKDTGGVSVCYGDCAVKWPPYLGAEADMAKMGEGWTLVDRTDGTKQWAYDGKPTYLFIDDKAKGDMMGDGMGGVWHELAE